jgi:two-component system response regulator HydG
MINRLERTLESGRLARRVERLERENEILRDAVGGAAGEGGLVGGSPGMERVRHLIDRVAASDASVLIRGETGTGKELVARAIHAQGPRAERPFVAFDCSTFAEGVLESELFGHERGAFTGADRRRVGRFELADADAVPRRDRDPAIGPGQAVAGSPVRAFERSAGRTLHRGVRVVAATNRDLEAAMVRRPLHEDLYHRLNG